MFMESRWTDASVLHIEVDAAGMVGAGGVCQRSWLFKTWSEEEIFWSIAVKELLAIIYACVHTDGKGRD